MIHRALEALRPKLRRGAAIPSEFVDPHALLGELRLFKDPEELRVMRAAADTRSRVEKLARDGAGVDVLVDALAA